MTPPLGDGVVRLGAYDGVLREAVRRFKYGRWFEMGDWLGRLLAGSLQQSALIHSAAVVVPMPMPWPRRVHRGIDHARVIGEALGATAGAPVARVLRKRQGPPQSNRTSSERRRAGGRGMGLRQTHLAGAQAILVDDVLTTGASARAAVRLLRKAGAGRVVIAVAAVSDPPGRPSSGPGRAAVETAPDALRDDVHFCPD